MKFIKQTLYQDIEITTEETYTSDLYYPQDLYVTVIRWPKHYDKDSIFHTSEDHYDALKCHDLAYNSLVEWYKDWILSGSML